MALGQNTGAATVRSTLSARSVDGPELAGARRKPLGSGFFMRGSHSSPRFNRLPHEESSTSFGLLVLKWSRANRRGEALNFKRRRRYQP